MAGRRERPLRLAVYTDYVYKRDGDAIYAQRAFALFLARLGRLTERLVIAGRLDPEPGRSHYRLPADVDFVALPHYPSLARPLKALPALVRSIGRCWRALDGVDGAWVLGPYPLSFVLVALAALRRRRIILGVRQDWPRYVRSRHPDNRPLQLVAEAMEGAYRLLARRYPIVVVGPELAGHYRRARAVLPITVSMVDAGDIATPPPAAPLDGTVRVLSVGRLETEKNPLLLADVLARLRARDSRWRLVVAGEGPLRADLERRLAELGVGDAAQLVGYIPIGGGLMELYRGCDFFLHVSWTEGLPQVIFEAFAAGLPTVATAVGGVPQATGDAAVLVPPGDADAPAQALLRLAGDDGLRADLARRGVDRARAHTTDAECRRIVDFIAEAARRRG